MSFIKHHMIERREIDLSIPKDELLIKILKTYHIENPSKEILDSLKITLVDGILKIRGTHESLVAEITPEFNDSIEEIKPIDCEDKNSDELWVCRSPESIKGCVFRGKQLTGDFVKVPDDDYYYWSTIGPTSILDSIMTNRGIFQAKYGKLFFIKDKDADLEKNGNIAKGAVYAMTQDTKTFPDASGSSKNSSWQIRKIDGVDANGKIMVSLIKTNLSFLAVLNYFGYKHVGLLL